MATTALEEDHSAARIPKDSSPPFCSVTSCRILSWRSCDGLPRQDHGQPSYDALHQVGDGQKTEQGGQKEKKGKDGKQQIVSELRGPAEAIVFPDFLHDARGEFLNAEAAEKSRLCRCGGWR